MNLYNRDFSTPNSPEEIDALEAEKRWEAAPGIKTPSTVPRFAHVDEASEIFCGTLSLSFLIIISTQLLLKK